MLPVGLAGRLPDGLGARLPRRDAAGLLKVVDTAVVAALVDMVSM